MEDSELVRRALAGERGAFGELFRRHDPAAHCAIRLILEGADVDDARQQARLKALCRLADLRNGACFRAWYAQIARRAAFDLLRKRSREPGAFRADSLDAELAPDDRPAARCGAEARDQVLAVLGQLPERRREVFLCFEFHGMKYDEIAEHMGISRGTVAATLSQARAQLDAIIHL